MYAQSHEAGGPGTPSEATLFQQARAARLITSLGITTYAGQVQAPWYMPRAEAKTGN